MHAPICPECRVQLELSHICSYNIKHPEMRVYFVGVCPTCKFTFKGVNQAHKADQIISITENFEAKKFASIGAGAYILRSPSVYTDYSPGTHEHAD